MYSSSEEDLGEVGECGTEKVDAVLWQLPRKISAFSLGGRRSSANCFSLSLCQLRTVM